LAVKNVYVSLLLTYLFAVVVLFVVLFYRNIKNIFILDRQKSIFSPFIKMTISYGIISFIYMAFLYQEGREIDMNFRNSWVVTFNMVYIIAFMYIIELMKITMSKVSLNDGKKSAFFTWIKTNSAFCLPIITWGIHMLFGAALIVKYIVG
jgi:hypothetical protein